MRLNEGAEWPKQPLSRDRVIAAAREIEKKKSTWVNIGYINKMTSKLSANYRGGKINKATGEPYPTVEVLKYSEAQYMSGFNYGNLKSVKARNATQAWQERHPEGSVPQNPKIVSWIIPNIVGVTSAGNEVVSVSAQTKNRPNVRYYISIDGEPFRQTDIVEVSQYLQPAEARKLLATPEEKAERAKYKDDNGNAIEMNFATLYVSNIYAIKGEGELDMMQHRRRPKEVEAPQENNVNSGSNIEDSEVMDEGIDFNSGKDFHYTTPLSDEDIDDILNVAKITYGYHAYIDGEYFGMEVRLDGGAYIYYKDTVIETDSPQETRAVLRDLDGALKDEDEKQNDYMRQQIPYLWREYKSKGYPECVRGDSIK